MLGRFGKSAAPVTTGPCPSGEAISPTVLAAKAGGASCWLTMCRRAMPTFVRSIKLTTYSKKRNGRSRSATLRKTAGSLGSALAVAAILALSNIHHLRFREREKRDGNDFSVVFSAEHIGPEGGMDRRWGAAFFGL